MGMLFVAGLFLMAFGGWHWWRRTEIRPETVLDIGAVWSFYAFIALTLIGKQRRKPPPTSGIEQ
jgi:hypothetical protein